jgi:hypothetical protein
MKEYLGSENIINQLSTKDHTEKYPIYFKIAPLQAELNKNNFFL